MTLFCNSYAADRANSLLGITNPKGSVMLHLDLIDIKEEIHYIRFLTHPKGLLTLGGNVSIRYPNGDKRKVSKFPLYSR